MLFRLLQLDELIITPYTTVQTGVNEDNNLLDFTLQAGSQLLTTQPRLTTREIVVQGTFNYTNNFKNNPHNSHKPYTKIQYWNELKKLQRKNVDVFLVGQDDRIYHCRGYNKIVQKDSDDPNSFDFTLTIEAYNTYLTDITDFLFYRVFLERPFELKTWRYGNEITFNYYACHSYPLFYCQLPSGFDALWYKRTLPTPVTLPNTVGDTVNDGTGGGQLVNNGGTGDTVNTGVNTVTPSMGRVYDGTATGARVKDGSALGAFVYVSTTATTYTGGRAFDGSLLGAKVYDGTANGAYVAVSEGLTINTQNIETKNIENLITISRPSTVITNNTGAYRVYIVGYFPNIGENISIDDRQYNLTNYKYFCLTDDGFYVGDSIYGLQLYEARTNVFTDPVEVVHSSVVVPSIYYQTSNVII